ncbi:MAG: tRNA (guanosine(46)-N7)-methyltransferase TrmB, partial [Mangrovibacterium sp.]
EKRTNGTGINRIQEIGVVGKNKIKKFAEMAGFSNVVQASFNVLGQQDYPLRGKWRSDFFGNDHPLILELGCGKGEYTVSLADREPDCNYIGVDIKGARMWKGAKEALERKLGNVAFLRTNIELIDLFFAPGEVEQIWLTFPDPQMKNGRRRLTATNFMEKYRRMLVPGGVVHLKTDSNFQYRYVLEMVRENKLNILSCTDDLDRSDLLDEALSVQTFYEKQWRDRGISIKYIRFQLDHNEPLREPDVEIEKDPYRSFGRSAKP